MAQPAPEANDEDSDMSSVDGENEEAQDAFTAGSLLQYDGKVFLPKWHCSHKIAKAQDYISDPKSEDDTYSVVLRDKLIANNDGVSVASEPEERALPDVPSFESGSPDKKEIKQQAVAAYDMSCEAIEVAQEA